MKYRACHRFILLGAAFLTGVPALAEPVMATHATNTIEVQAVSVAGKVLPVRTDEIDLGKSPENIIIHYEPGTNWTRLPIRLHYQLEGYDANWHEGSCEMYLVARFYNDAGDETGQQSFTIQGQSAGWNGSLKTSPLTHRRETLTVPSRATRLMLVITSAGPPATEGIYAVANLTVLKLSGNSPPTVLMESPLDQPPAADNTIQSPRGWIRDGNHASMARVAEIGRDSATRAFAIFDDDPLSHAEWHNTLDTTGKVNPGDRLVIEWNEMYSMGVGDSRMARYDELKPGTYQFRVQELDIFGIPTGVEGSLKIIVPPPVWRTPWFWSLAAAGMIIMVLGIGRYVIWRKVQAEMLQLKSQQALERERLRIAHDIHDDLGARVTQISLLSAMSQENQAYPDKARADFDRISRMSRELVSALYETVWAVNPENDNLDALGNYLCQMVNRLCEPSSLRCRLHVSDLPRTIQVSSQTRHNISMAVKEAVHNIIKHAKASEVIIQIAFTANVLTISVQDDGCGFPSAPPVAGGHGLANIKRRLEDIGGSSWIDSQPGKGTSIHLRLVLKPATISGA